MSILVTVASAVPSTAPATVPAGPEVVTPTHLLYAAGMLAWSAAVGYLLGAFRSASVSGPPRPAHDTKPVIVFLVLIGGFVVWFGMQIAYMSVRVVEHRHSGSDAPFSTAVLSPADFGFLSTVPYIAGLLALMFGDALAKRSLPRELGWSAHRLLRGVAIGALAMVAVMPLMMAASFLLEWLYQLVGFQHPTEHELLTVLAKSTQPLTIALIVGGATLLAPVFEEFLFRGHLQTVLIRAFTPRPRQQMPALPPDPALPEGSPLPLPPPVLPPVPPPAPEVVLSPVARWAAIAVTSLLFSVLHPGWTWPLIFLLSITLGYAYERTANLWVPVTMHLIFNTLQTLLFIHSRSL